MSLAVTKHAIEQYRNRVALNNLIGRDEAIRSIIMIFSEAKYVSDKPSGILFRHDVLGIELIVKDRKIITMYRI